MKAPRPLAAGAVILFAALAALLAALPGCRSPAGEAPPVEAGGSLPETGGIPSRRPVPAAGLAAYAGSQTCVRCHAAEAGQLETHHARTLARVDAAVHAKLFERPARIYDARAAVTYQPAVRGGKCLLEATQGGVTQSVEPVYAFGSGNRAQTFVGLYQGSVAELRLTYYRQAARWDFTPGQRPGQGASLLMGSALDRQAGEECFNCHSTALVSEQGEPQPARSVLGVGCEACHGPGRAHIEAVQRGSADRHLAKLSLVRDRISIELCGQCHRTRAAGDPHNPETSAQIPRLQGFALALSRCFQKSNGQLSCVTCHNPHRDADRTSRAEYNAQCRACHTPNHPLQVVCKAQPSGDCVACHMPRQPVSMPTRPLFTTHWIKIWDQGTGQRAKRQGAGG
jgi:hypothetical protein